MLPDRNRLTEGLHNCEGIDPVIELTSKNSCDMRNIFPSELGILPVNTINMEKISFEFVESPSDNGMVPEIRLKCR